MLAIAVTLISTFTITLSLSMCDYEEPDLSKYEEQLSEESLEVQSPYGMYDYSMRAFFSNEGPVVYKSDVYVTVYGLMSRIPLSSLDCDLRTATEETHHLPESYSVCPDSTHNHEGKRNEIANECPGYTGDTSLLIDAYESAGGYPIIYYATNEYGEYNLEGEWVDSLNHHILRYDSGAVKREHIVELSSPAIQLMTYDDRLFFITRSAEGEYQLHSIGKDGEDHKTLSFGGEQITMIDVYNRNVILRDLDATIYEVDFDLTKSEEIFQVEEDLMLSWDPSGFVFTHDGYLYYCDDFETVDYQPYPDREDFIVEPLSHSVRRLPLDDLKGEGELVVENVYDDQMYGIVDNVFYYAPCEPVEFIDGWSFNYTNGKIKGIDLKTLEPIEMREDAGIFASVGKNFFMNGDGLFAYFFIVREGYFTVNLWPYDENDYSTIYYCIYDIKTGSLYPLCY